MKNNQLQWKESNISDFQGKSKTQCISCLYKSTICLYLGHYRWPCFTHYKQVSEEIDSELQLVLNSFHIGNNQVD